ncbi:DUF6737 family protein [Egbenema bharatensis]|uniref:DUF6737 family protein n=1 Tax=Egbenema bharatensis TaxID=3463334 RepID=UPI003A871803
MQPGSEPSSSTSVNPPSINIWHYKPWWCQPWSILLTGIGIISGSWVLLRIMWVTVLVAIPIGVWMFFFLGVYPKLMAEELLRASGGHGGDQSA